MSLDDCNTNTVNSFEIIDGCINSPYTQFCPQRVIGYSYMYGLSVEEMLNKVHVMDEWSNIDYWY